MKRIIALLAVWGLAVAMGVGNAWAWPVELPWWQVILFLVAAVTCGLVLWSARQPGTKPLFVGLALGYGALNIVALSSLGAAWWGQGIGTGTPASPASITNPTDPAQLTQVLAYAQSLTYDSVTHRAADERFLTLVDTVTVDTSLGARGQVRLTRLSAPGRFRKLVGPRAKIVPEALAYLNSQQDLTGSGGGRGRIVARVFVDSTYVTPNGIRRPSGGYPYLNLPPGLSYLWVDSLQVRGRTGTARLVIIPADRQYGPRVRRLTYTHNRRGWQRQSRARWVFDMTNDPDSWNLTCPFGCCE